MAAELEVCKSIFLTIILSALSIFSTAQEQFFGIKSGIVEPSFLNKGENSDVAFYGFHYEYVPKNALFSVSADALYLAESKWLITPISLNFRPGEKLRIIASGGALPIFRLQKAEPNKTLSIGALYKLGAQYQIKNKYSIQLAFGNMLIAYQEETMNHFGGSSSERATSTSNFVEICLKYNLSL